MASTILTSLDGLSFSKSGSLGGGSDSGGDMQIMANCSDVDIQVVTDVPSTSAGCGLSSPQYSAGMSIDWDGVFPSIPDGAHILNVRIRVDYNYSAGSSVQFALQAGANLQANGNATCRINGFLSNPPGGTYTPTTNNGTFSDLDQDVQGAPLPALNLSASIANSGTLEYYWDFETVPETPLGYITRDELIAEFAGSSFGMLVTSSATGSQTPSWDGSGPLGHADVDIDTTFTLTMQNWIMNIEWEESWVITNITPNPAASEDEVTIDGEDLDTIEDVTLQYENAKGETVTIPITLTGTPTQMTFTMPNLGAFQGTATLFSGSVPLGTLTIYIAAGTGIYRIVPDKRTDSQYDRSDGSVEEVAIPEPFGETGFIGG